MFGWSRDAADDARDDYYERHPEERAEIDKIEAAALETDAAIQRAQNALDAAGELQPEPDVSQRYATGEVRLREYDPYYHDELPRLVSELYQARYKRSPDAEGLEDPDFKQALEALMESWNEYLG
jgi:hypothetical protein